jgi:hypothetical protein
MRDCAHRIRCMAEAEREAHRRAKLAVRPAEP